MTRLTTDFGITGPVEFLDVHVERDNRLFLDPSAIRVAARSGDPHGLTADAALTAFFDKTLTKLRSTNPHDHQAGEKALQHFSELGETRLGLSRTGTNGHGAAEELGTRIWDELFSNPLCQHAIATLKYVEDVPLFVDGIDRDVTSDLTARIILETLEQFTADMMVKHSEFTTVRSTTTLTTHYWDSAQGSWKPKTLTLPEAHNKPLLLVPKAFVNFKLQMTYGQYYGVPLLDYIKWEDTVKVLRRNRAVDRPRFTKKILRQMPAYKRGRKTSKDQTVRIFEKDGTDVLGGYRAESQSSFVPLSDSQLDYYLDRVPR